MSSYQENVGRELDWNDTIQKDNEFTVLPAGDYKFEVTDFERGRHPGSAKLPECNKAIITIRLTGSDGVSSTVKHNLFLHTTTEGMICEFFTAIGSRKHGDVFRMDWDAVMFATGTAKVGIRKWVSEKSGDTIESNEIKRFYAPDKAPRIAAAPPPPQKTFVPGDF